MWLRREPHAEVSVVPRIGVRELKVRASEVLRDVRDNRARYVVTHRGEPVGLIVPYSPGEAAGRPAPDESWARLLESLDSLGNAWNTSLTSTEALDELRRYVVTPGPLTIDAGVFLSAANPREEDHEASRRFLERARAVGTPVELPTFVLPEVAAAARRISGSPELGRLVAHSLKELARVVLVPLDEALAESAVEPALEGGMRGGDAVYGATAQHFAATLVTLDRQQRERLPRGIEVLSPAEACAELAE